MNRSLRGVMVGVAGFAVFGMTATLVGAQTDAVKEKPRPYRDDSYWVFPRAHWGDVTKTTPRVTRRSSLQRSQLIAISFPGSIRRRMLQLSPLLRSSFSAAILLAGYASFGWVGSSSRPGWDASAS